MGRFNDLPKGITFEILTRLPTESALECKLVCKIWRDLVNLPSFSELHLNHLNSADDDSGKLNFIIMSSEQGLAEFYYTEYENNCDGTPFIRQTRMNLNLPCMDYCFSGSHSGLICFDTWEDDNCIPAYICNPVTRECIMLPRSQGDYWWTGFGYIHSTNEYKVVSIYESEGESNVGIVQVYTVGSGTGWRNEGTADVNMEYVSKFSGRFVSGAIHWENHHAGTIIAFHLNDEKFSELPAPPCWTPNAPRSSICLRVLGDFLCSIYYPTDRSSEIWLFKKNKDTCNDLRWRKEFSFDSYIWGAFGFTKSGRLLCY
ncbi:F-box protein At3g07870-like [Papaver somniferum]|uniref:F-box protein At3g07870-like n=1 Tax=Papaver somniferum TaxID=3469 RepID=UPI000E6FC9F3|nr:F-box protein At3g07870-like [Papaver somniferum]